MVSKPKRYVSRRLEDKILIKRIKQLKQFNKTMIKFMKNIKKYSGPKLNLKGENTYDKNNTRSNTRI